MMSIINSIWNYHCPQCRKGELFTKPFTPKNPLSMHDHCEVCYLRFVPEPGFYYGAMFLSYIVTGFLYLGIIGLLIMGLGLSIEAAFGLLILFVALTYFKTARLARSLWIHLMIKFDPKQPHSDVVVKLEKAK